MPENTRPDRDIPYLALDPDIETRIRTDRQNHIACPWRFPDERVVRREDNPHDTATLTRPAFARDIEKILNVPAYNRYADKTQVFSFVENDDLCRRGLHVQLVSRIARGIGALLGLNLDLIEAIALGHDVGHTPFGHAGEHFLSERFHDHTGRFFNHNVHSVRVLDKLYRRNVSLQTLDGVLCHNGEFAQQTLRLGSMPDFATLDAAVEACTADEQEIKHLCPSTLEGCVVRVSDMIAYIGKDRQDALAFGLVDSLDQFDASIIGRSNAQIINNMTVDIVNHSYGRDHISMSPEAFADLKRAKRQNYELIYHDEGVIKGAGNVVQEMFGELYEKLRDDAVRHDEDSPLYRHHIRQLALKSRTLRADEYLANGPDQVVVDYIASMTDSYFMALHGFLFPGSPNRVAWRDYCADLREARADKK